VKHATLRIWRGAAGETGRFETYAVPYEPGQSVLDGLRVLRAEVDSTLAVRFSCINANACKECVILVDGKPAYACATRLEAREMQLEPLRNKPWIRDLVSDIAPPAERLLPPGKS
jgi:succinate dehydrogenase / fumarate reductase iron-sulfur subunit